MSDYISKPFRLADLNEGIERWLPDNRLTAARTPNSVVPAIGSSIRGRRRRPTDAKGEAAQLPFHLDELSELGATTAELDEIVACYIETSADSIDQMRAAINSRDRESLRSLAHKLKNGSGHVGAHKVASVCLELNTAATDNWYSLGRAKKENKNAQLR